MRKSFLQKLSAWYKGSYDFTLKTADHMDARMAHEYTGKEHKLREVERKELVFSGVLYNILCVLFCLIFIGVCRCRNGRNRSGEYSSRYDSGLSCL